MPPTWKDVYRNVGLRVFLRPLDVVGAPLMNVGESGPDAVAKGLQVERSESFDEGGGQRVLTRTRVVQAIETFTLKVRNHDPNIKRLFLMAQAPGSYSRAATAVSNQVYVAKRGYSFELVLPVGHTDAGKRAGEVGSVVVTGPSGTPTHVAGVDYILDAVKAVISIPTNSAIADASNVEVDYTPVAASVADGLILPQTLVGGVECYAEIWEVADSGARQWRRTIPRLRISGEGSEVFGMGPDNEYDLLGTVLNDITSAAPAGEYTAVKS